VTTSENVRGVWSICPYLDPTLSLLNYISHLAFVFNRFHRVHRVLE